MIVDGKKLAEEIKSKLCLEILSLGNKKVRLAIIQVGGNLVTEKFLKQKKDFGISIGIDVRVYKLPETISNDKLRRKISEVLHIKKNTGVVIQLPLPKQINSQYILDSITPAKDPDMLSSKSVGLLVTGRSAVLPPVVGAIKYIFDANDVELEGRHAVIVGAGRLVGRPLAIWLLNQNATITVLNEHTPDLKSHTIEADLVISGAGHPRLVTPDMIKDGAIVIDAGTSGSRGQIVGDVDPKVADKASLFTPVPGGVGPLTVAMLFSNLVKLAKK
jgi:methylenetetrahydrofolate dehydrogenase (NADP+) / methenyltetrahydrofolate cyclohydrolase